MAGTIYGVMGLADSTRVSSVGEAAVYDAITALLAQYNADLERAMSCLVQPGFTTDYKENYYVPSGGQMQELDEYGRPAAVKPSTKWDVSFDLRMFGDQFAKSDVALAKMTLGDAQRDLESITMRHTDTIRFQVLKHLLNKTNDTFVDPEKGSLTIRRLANGDGTYYPPVLGATAEAEETHYYGVNYTSISASNNVYATLRAELIEHFGDGEIVTFINSAQVAETTALSAFRQVQDAAVREGSATGVVVDGLPTVPGTIIGKIDGGTWISNWQWIPSAYVMAINLSVPAPLKKRLDPETELQGLKLVAQETEYPLRQAYYRDRIGFGVANRLAGAVAQLVSGTTYSTPSAYA